MATQKQANDTLEFHQKELLKNNNVAYIAVVPKLDDSGNPTDEYVIEVGVYNKAAQEKGAEAGIQALKGAEVVPSSLAIPQEGDLTVLSDQNIKVVIDQTDGFEIQSYTDRRRPANGGCSVSNFRYNSAGTLGAAVTVRGQSGIFFLSNWHVLAGGSGRNGDPILQQGRFDGGTHPQDRIATLYWSRLDSSFDAAIARVDGNSVSGGTRCFGNIPGHEAARVGMNVKKCGRTTRLTSGSVRSVNATVRVGGYPSGVMVFTNQILTTHMSQPGDSGSVICNAANNRAVGLLFAGDGRTQTIANHIGPLIGSTITASVVNHEDGASEEMPEIEIEGLLQ